MFLYSLPESPEDEVADVEARPGTAVRLFGSESSNRERRRLLHESLRPVGLRLCEPERDREADRGLPARAEEVHPDEVVAGRRGRLPDHVLAVDVVDDAVAVRVAIEDAAALVAARARVRRDRRRLAPDDGAGRGLHDQVQID